MAAPLILPSTVQLDPATLGRQEAEKILKPLRATMEAYRCFPTDVIVVKWIRETIGTSGNLLASAKTRQEDEWQGKTALVLKVGDHAFEDEGDLKFHGFCAKVGEWVQMRNSDGDDFSLIPPGTMNAYHCRRLWHGQVQAILAHPDMIL